METFILSEQQLVMLHFIYGKRRNLILGTASSLPFLIYQHNTNLNNPSRNFDLFKILNLLLILLVLIVLIFLFFFRLTPLKKDMRYKSGIYLSQTLIRKDSFPFVGKYFFYFDNEKYPNKEVTESEYYSFEVGQTYKIPIAKNSGVVVDGFMNYKLL